MPDQDKYEEAVRLLNASGYAYILIDHTDIRERAEEKGKPAPDDEECAAIIETIADGVWATAHYDIDGEL